MPKTLLPDAPEGMPARLQRHVLALGLRSFHDYRIWCLENGFRAEPRKSPLDLHEEREAVREIEARREAQARLHRHPARFIEAACAGETSSDSIDRPLYKLACAEIEGSDADPARRASLADFLVRMLRHGDMVFQTVAGANGAPFVRGLVKLHDRKALWLRDPDAFRPRSKNRERLFGELTHHLFDRYGDVPRFMERVWLRDDRPAWRYRDWYVHLGRGHNLRTAKLPVALTRKMAHLFLQAPDRYEPEQAIRHAQLRALGADQPLIDAVVATRIGRRFEEEAFWHTFLRFVAEAPMLDPRQVGPLVDYVHNRKFVGEPIERAPGVFVAGPPPQPGFSLRGRDAATLLGQMEVWHRRLGRDARVAGSVFAPAPFEGYVRAGQGHGARRTWSIRQLRTGSELAREGAALRHCVVSYAGSCERGACTIWSLSCRDGDVLERRQTIEVNRHGVIVQCRGFCNADPTSEEMAVVRAWASAERLQLSDYLA